MEYSINLTDIWNITKRNMKLVLICTIIFALLAGAYGYMKTKPAEVSKEDMEAAGIQQETYEKWLTDSEAVKNEMQEKLVAAYHVIGEHPILEMDPEDVSWRILTFTLDDSKEVSRTATFTSWVDKLGIDELFEGIKGDKTHLKKYRREFISVSGNIGEITVVILNSSYYNMDSTAATLKKYLENQAKKADIKILASENIRRQGYDQGIVDRQDILHNDANRITNELNTLNNYKMEQPEGATEAGSRDYKKLLMLIIAGAIFGAVLGAAVASFNVIRRGTVLSAAQVEDFFAIEHLASGSAGDAAYPKVAGAVINAIDDTQGDILVVANGDDKTFEGFVAGLDAASDREYVYADASSEDINVLDKINKAAGAIIPVTIGVTTYKDIHAAYRWIQKFKKDLFGYLVLE